MERINNIFEKINNNENLDEVINDIIDLIKNILNKLGEVS